MRNLPGMETVLGVGDKLGIGDKVMATVSELYKEHEQPKRDGNNDEAIAKHEELLKQDEKHVRDHLAL